MRSVFDETTHADLQERLNRLSPAAERQWGKMSAAQMAEHTARALEMAMARTPGKQMLIGKVLSWAFRKEFLGEAPFKQGRPTGKNFIITDEPEFDSTRTRLSSLITEFHKMGEAGVDGNIHGFFGPLTGKQWGETQYKHLDHHFRQFGV